MSLTGPVEIQKCDEEWNGYRCVLVAGHGIANPCVHFDGTVVEGHLYAQYGEDLSESIRTQNRLDYIASLEHEVEHLRAALSLAESEAGRAIAEHRSLRAALEEARGRYSAQVDYVIALQRLIEALARGETPAPVDVAPFHSDKATVAAALLADARSQLAEVTAQRDEARGGYDGRIQDIASEAFGPFPAAEQERDLMRVVCAAAEIYLPGEGCITEPACGACRYCDLYRAVDEWRRTRQSKEPTP